jgi:hypothetical protein
LTNWTTRRILLRRGVHFGHLFLSPAMRIKIHLVQPGGAGGGGR